MHVSSITATSVELPKVSQRRFRDQLLKLEELIKNPPEESRVIEFSPLLAAHVLKTYSRGNRPLKPGKIKTYARELASNNWGLTGDTIKFGSDGLLRDGQNRLSACIRAGRPLRTHVVFGIDAQLFPRMDIGKNRNGADVFSIEGIDHAVHAAGSVRWILILDSENPADRGAQFSNDDLLKAYREKIVSNQLEHSIQRALDVKSTTRHPVAPLAALHYLFSRRDRQKADAFYEEWASGHAKKARAPSRYLQRRLLEVANATNKRVHENVRNALIITAWNAYVAGRSLTKKEMNYSPGDPFPKIAE